MKDYKITYAYKGQKKTYITRGCNNERIAESNWRFMCIKSKKRGAEIMSIKPVTQKVKHVNVCHGGGTAAIVHF